jgi:large subunit ribosomal protein L10
MPRPEKVQAVAEIKERLERARAVFLAEYAGLSVKEQQKLRRGLRKGGAEFKVVKMTLARRAAADLQLAELDELFLGPTGIAFTDGDPVTAAKALKDFAKENESFIVKGGLLGAEFLSPERISELAEIESRDVLLAKLAGAMKAPMANLAGLAAALPRNLASALQQLVDKKGGDGAVEAPAVEAEGAEDSPQQKAEEETTGDAVATDAAAVEEAEDTADESEESADTDAPKAADDSAAEETADDDGDDAKSVDKESAEEAEEE